MDLSKTIDEIGKYLNEILGYLLPGLTLVFLVYFFIDPNQVKLDSYSNLDVWLIIFISYVTGYVVYGFSMLRDVILRNKTVVKWSERKYFSFLKDSAEVTKKSICKTQEFDLVKEKLAELIPRLDTTKLTFHSVRNFAMAYVPEVDQKIYTFMFRADLFDHIKVIFYLVFFWGIAGYFFTLLFNNTLLFNTTSDNNIYFLFILLIFAYPLKLGRKRFLRIAYNIQFHIFLAKLHKG